MPCSALSIGAVHALILQTTDQAALQVWSKPGKLDRDEC